ncbi:MAG: M20 metallopeptidase family protein [Clostridium sp.]|uniref:M20 metallopeptidase family protein n=1 Tax=Clostridium TaxID=1485 RepID=UPI002152C00B|nr:amidohydrolase [Clostridium sp. LY3-2]MCR6516018.1 amidohydrolase [Clostridium sp. LY3-2]
MINIKKDIKDIKNELVEIRRDIHENPELGFEEFRTQGLIIDLLEKEGIPYKKVAKTGVLGIIKGEGKENPNRCIGIRGDMDALPIEEKNGCPYASKIKGRMHACGHDAHTTILLGVAKVLNKNKDKFSGTVKLFFEPAEETTGGAEIMINEGVLDSPNVDCVIGLHVAEDVEVGTIRIKNGMVNAASNPFKITIKGAGGHGAQPSATIDPIVIGANVVTALQGIVSREISAVNPAVVTIGKFHSGTAQNIIPEEAIIEGIIRTTTPEDREFAIKRLEEISKGVSASLRGEATVEIEESYPCLINDSDIVDLIKESASYVLGSQNVIEQKNPSMGVESFAYFAMARKSAFYYLGTGNSEKGTDKPAHSRFFNIDEDALELGVEIQCTAALNYLTGK